MKKKNLFIIAILILFISVSNVSAANITACDAVLENAVIDEKIPKTVSTIITLIKIAAPVILVIFGMLDLFKGIMQQKEDEIKKGQQIFIKRLISGALIFFVFSIVQFIVGFVADSSNRNGIMDCVQCFINYDCKSDAEKVGEALGEAAGEAINQTLQNTN